MPLEMAQIVVDETDLEFTMNRVTSRVQESLLMGSLLSNEADTTSGEIRPSCTGQLTARVGSMEADEGAGRHVAWVGEPMD